ncbi:MAG: hypothetical protein WAP51_02995 [Candidatus Sungiibacteriota bacterium]
MSKKPYFKVLRKDLTSLGLLGARRIRYRRRGWTTPGEPISNHPRKGGGLWVLKRRSDAKQVKKRMRKEYRVSTRIFTCRIGKKIPKTETSYRVKTDKVRLTEEISV